MTLAQIETARLKLQRMLYWLINESSAAEFNQTAHAVARYALLLENAEKKLLLSKF